MADLQQLSGLAHRLHHGARTVNGVAHHLFAIDVQARLQAGVGDGRVPEIRRGDDDRLQIFFLGQQILVIFVIVDLKAVGLESVLCPSCGRSPRCRTTPTTLMSPVFMMFISDSDSTRAFRAVTDERDIERVQCGFLFRQRRDCPGCTRSAAIRRRRRRSCREIRGG